MFQADSDMTVTHIIAILTLKTEGRGHRHLCIEVDIFTEALPLTRPAGISPQVHGRSESPGDVAGTCLVGRDA